jgi:hypothetical protein
MEHTGGGASAVDWPCIPPCGVGTSGEMTIVSDAPPQILACFHSPKAEVGDSEEGFKPTENDGSNGWTDVTGIVGVRAKASIVLFFNENVLDEECVLPEWGGS